MNKNINKILTCLMLLVIGGLCSCTDTWDEHYKGDEDPKFFDGTIMEMLQQNPNLSNFAKVVEATGFDIELNSAQSYTLWAPENDALSDEEWTSWIEMAKTDTANVVTRFIKNHMTRYNVSLDDKAHVIKLLNTKTAHMTDAATAKFGDADIVSANNACQNGVVHVISAAQTYFNNLYEAVEQDFYNWKKANGITLPDDSIVALYTFLKKYNADSLDQKRSVSIGVDENGEYIWIDSVMMRNNTILKSYDALLYTEDSVYSMLLPSVEAYQARYEEAKKCLVFNPMENVADQVDKKTSTTDSLQHYYASTFAMNDLFYNDNYNKHANDSVVSTQWIGGSRWEQHRFYSPYTEGGIFTKGRPAQCSNGTVYYCDEYPMSIYDQFLKKVDMQCNSGNVDLTPSTGDTYMYVKQCNYYSTSVTNPATGKNLSYFRIESQSSANPTITFQVRNLLKADYDMYLVYIPLWVSRFSSYEEAYEQAMADSLAYAEGDASKVSWNSYLRPYNFKVTTFQRQGDAKKATDVGKYPTRGTTISPADGAKTFITRNENVVDTMYLGTVTMDYAYYQTDKEGLLVQFATQVTNKEKDLYSRDMNFIEIIFVPRKDVGEAGRPMVIYPL